MGYSFVTGRCLHVREDVSGRSRSCVYSLLSRAPAHPWYASWMDWYDEMATELAAAAGLQLSDLALPDALRTEILDLARIASHDSGARINAPFLCYALGIAVGRGTPLDELARVVRLRSGA
jgi:hypothetical protein